MSQFGNSSAMIANRFKITDTTTAVKASGGILTLTGQPLDNETTTIGTKTYRWETDSGSLSSDGDVLISPVDAAESIFNLVAAIKVDPAHIGARYASNTTIHPDVIGSEGAGDTMDVIARRPGDFGNSIALSETLTNGSWNQAFLTGGISPADWLKYDPVNRKPTFSGAKTFQIEDDTDFPNDPVAGVIDLDTGFYVFKGDYTSFNRFNILPSSTVEFFSETGFNATITYLGDGTFISGTAFGTFNIRNFILVLAGNNNQYIDTTFGDVFGVDNAVVFAGTGTRKIGTIRFAATTDLSDSFFQDYIDGIEFNNCAAIVSGTVLYQGTGAGTGPHYSITGSLGFAAFISDLIFPTLGASESAFFINPNIGDFAQVSIDRCLNLGTGEYFESKATGAISGYIDSSIASTTINSVSIGTAIPGGGNYARFNFTVGPNVFVGQKVTNVGYTTNANYNATGLVSVNGFGLFELNDAFGLPVTFGTDEGGGSFTSDATTATSTAHGLTELTELAIENSISYDAGYAIFDVQVNTFQFNAVFVGFESGGPSIWNTGSLTQKDKRLNVQNSGSQPDSMNVAFGGMNGNTGATTISSADTYQAMDFNTMVQDPSTELWTLIDVTAGIFRYDGLNPVSGSLVASITATKTGSTAIFRFTDSINGAVPVFATKAYVPIEIKTTQVSATLLRPVNVVPGDTIQIMGGEETTTDSITITDFFMQIII